MSDAGQHKDHEAGAKKAVIAALFANMDDVKLDTNIDDIEVKTQKAAGVSGKLAKLRNMRKK